MLPLPAGRFLTQVKNGLLLLLVLVVLFLALVAVVLVPVVPAAHGVPLAVLVHAAGAVAFAAAGRLLRGFLARLRFLGQRCRAEREGGGRAGADEEGTNCFHLELLVVVG
jgi:hypothetical protein